MIRSSRQCVAWWVAALSLAHAVASAASPRQLDEGRLTAAGIRILEGRHLRLVTDLPSSAAVDELPMVFDAAIPAWAAYFSVRPGNLDGARWLGFLIEDRERFADLGLMPQENPSFPSGYARDWEFWLAEQPSDYYRRHLMLHEGTHAFMQTQLGGCGPGWFMEGVAELLGTHQWRDGRLRLGEMPANRDDVPMWGRIKLVRDALAAGRQWPLEAVLEVDNSRVMSTEEYSWTWALAALLDGHPQFQARFRQLQRDVRDSQFTRKFRDMFAKDWSDLNIEWQAYVAELDYGYDVPRMAIVHRDVARLDSGARRATIDAARGWQSTGWLLRAGTEHRLAASGRYTIANDERPWPCEPGGVTIEYHRGQPLGALLGALRPVGAEPEPTIESSFARPLMIGLGTMATPQRDSVLYVRVNDSAAKLGDNAGSLTLQIQQASQR